MTKPLFFRINVGEPSFNLFSPGMRKAHNCALNFGRTNNDSLMHAPDKISGQQPGIPPDA